MCLTALSFDNRERDEALATIRAMEESYTIHYAKIEK
jgi:hypothetical protein